MHTGILLVTAWLTTGFRLCSEEFACNGSLVDDEDMGQVIQLQGDQRTKILAILLEEGVGKHSHGSFPVLKSRQSTMLTHPVSP